MVADLANQMSYQHYPSWIHFYMVFCIICLESCVLLTILFVHALLFPYWWRV